MKHCITILLLFLTVSVNAQLANSNQSNEVNARWVNVPNTEAKDAGLYLFRKKINLESVPSDFIIHISADNKYKLFVNEKLVSVGPSWGDIDNWNYDMLNLAPYLKAGDNIISAQVWNEGAHKAVAQFSYQTGFWLQGTDEMTITLNTNDTWICIEDKSYTPIAQYVNGYYAAGAGEKIDMNAAIKNWKSLNFDDRDWLKAKPIFEQSTRGMGFDTQGGWKLTPSVIPPMELTYQRLATTRLSEGANVPSSFPEKKSQVTIPSNTTAKILLDQSFLTNAYPTLVYSGGEDGTIVITYSEALYDENGAKNNRNEITGKHISGRQDSIFSNGTLNQEFTPLSWRTYRYVELKIETKNSPLVIDDFYGTFTGYPFELNATLTADVKELNKIFDIGWLTARLCAVDTYMDCPYYERLQYIGDTRIQMMISYYNSGDDRLPKNAINLFDNSRQKDGYTLSRYPDTQSQVIPTYSLWHISTMLDYLMYGKDKNFLASKLLGSRQILNYFISYIDEDGSLKNVPGWNFTDWAPEFSSGIAPMSDDGSSALMDLQLLLAFQSAAILEKSIGSQNYYVLYDEMAKSTEKIIYEKYWDDSSKLFADTPNKDVFSQHTNSLAILAGLIDDSTASEIAKRMLNDKTLAQASIYFKYYLHQALTKAGLGDNYLDWLDIWREYIELGLTTWGETSEVETTRSDCHAWGSSPNIDFFRIILGIESDAPYFEKVKIKPNLGKIEKIKGEMPHPQGKISVDYQKQKDILKAKIILPEGISGTFIWDNREYILTSGLNEVNITGRFLSEVNNTL